MLISFIVPAFNVESYIERCIDSICNQNLLDKMYEILVVNDGSTDNTKSKVEKLITKYSNHSIILINKPNGGLSSARNIGLAYAKGKYIWFVDSDDYIANNCLNEIYNNIERHQEADVFVFNTDYIYDHKPSLRNDRRLPAMTLITGSELYLKDFRYPYSGVQFAIYKYTYLQSINLRFKESILFEDILYTTLLLASNPKCLFINKVYYHYYIRSGSITNSKSSIKKCLDILTVADELYSKINKDGYNSIVIYDQISRLLAAIYRYRMQGLSIKEILQIVKNVNKKPYWGKAIWKCNKYKYTPYLILNLILRPFAALLSN